MLLPQTWSSGCFTSRYDHLKFFCLIPAWSKHCAYCTLRTQIAVLLHFMLFLLRCFTLCLICLSLRAEISPIIDIEGVRGELLLNVRAHLGLSKTQASLHAEDAAQLQQQVKRKTRTALEALGFYTPTITITPHDNRWLIHIEQGTPVRIRTLSVIVQGSGAHDAVFRDYLAKLPLEPGQALHHGRYEDIKQTLKSRATEYGYFQASLLTHELTIQLTAQQADIHIVFDTGPRFHFGIVQFTDNPLALELLQRFIPFKTGDPYTQAQILLLQQHLESSGYFNRVQVAFDPEHASPSNLPITVTLTPKPKFQLAWDAGYSTDLGPRVGASLENRLLNRRGHRYRLSTQLARDKSELEASYSVPLEKPLTDQLHYIANATRTNDDLGQSLRYSLRTQWDRKLAIGWQQTLGVAAEHEHFRSVTGDRSTSTLILPSVKWSHSFRSHPQLPMHGYRWSLEAKGSDALLSSSDLRFLQLTSSGLWITPLGKQTRLLARGMVGATLINDELFERAFPTSLRYRTGGDRSVRGYDFNSLGIRNAQGELIGGRHLLVSSLEVDTPIRPNWRIAAFFDAGNAFNDFKQLELKRSVGLGVRWISPLGPIGVDVAHALDQDRGVRLHVAIGVDL